MNTIRFWVAIAAFPLLAGAQQTQQPQNKPVQAAPAEKVDSVARCENYNSRERCAEMRKKGDKRAGPAPETPLVIEERTRDGAVIIDRIVVEGTPDPEDFPRDVLPPIEQLRRYLDGKTNPFTQRTVVETFRNPDGTATSCMTPCVINCCISTAKPSVTVPSTRF